MVPLTIIMRLLLGPMSKSVFIYHFQLFNCFEVLNLNVPVLICI